ncbi:MAG: TatD family hydrolase [Bacteroidota bacterium]
MIPYVNIHTHHLSKEDGVFLFNNRFGFDREFYTSTYFSVGIHPWDARIEVNWNDFEKLLQHENCLAIGECGLDKLKGPDLKIQKDIFLIQLVLAVKHNKPVIIHCVKAFDELIDMCENYQMKIPIIIHGFNKSSQLAIQLIDHGFLISLNHSVFSKGNFDSKEIPMQKVFLETDTHSDLSIEKMYKEAAQFFNVEIDNLKEKIYLNFTDIFLRNGR